MDIEKILELLNENKRRAIISKTQHFHAAARFRKISNEFNVPVILINVVLGSVNPGTQYLLNPESGIRGHNIYLSFFFGGLGRRHPKFLTFSASCFQCPLLPSATSDFRTNRYCVPGISA
ncbi:MAG: hypothetical protein ABFS45_19685 [Pseudomonadota bacterium]